MKILDVPNIVEVLFVVSTLVFVGTLYLILPQLTNKKRMLFSPILMFSTWGKKTRRLSIKAQKIADSFKKNGTKAPFLMVRNES